LDSNDARPSLRGIDLDSHRQEAPDDLGVGREMAGHTGNCERRLTRRQGERHNELIGQIRVDGTARGEKFEQLVHGFIGHAFGRLPPLSEREEAGGGVFELRPQEQQRSRGAGEEACDLQLDRGRVASEPANGLVPLPLGDARI
jgi:hypothetical protein